MSSLSLSPKVGLAPSVMPRTTLRNTVLGDFATAHRLPQDVIDIVQRGYAAGHVAGLTVIGRDAAGRAREYSDIWFDALSQDDEVRIDISNGRSVTEAVSVKLARAVAASARIIQAQGLTVDYVIQFSDVSKIASYGLTASTEHRGSTRTLFEVRPGFDKGIHLRHSSVW